MVARMMMRAPIVARAAQSILALFIDPWLTLILLCGIGDDALDELVKDTKKAADGLDDVKDSVKGIKPDGIDDTTDGLKETSTEAQKAHGKLKKLGETSMNKAVSGVKKLASGLGKVAIAAGKAVAKAMALAATGVGTMVTMAVKSYADYEQLTGGVDTLFGGNQSIRLHQIHKQIDQRH